MRGKTIALWGLAFKPNTDDMREAASRVLMESLWTAGAKVRAYDPVAMPECRRIYGERPDLILCKTGPEAFEGADALAIVTEWRSFAVRISTHINARAALAGRSSTDAISTIPSRWSKSGFSYYAIGRGKLHQ